MIDRCFTYAYGGGKMRAFFTIAGLSFLFAFVLFLVLSTPFALFGVPVSFVLYGALGCGIGTAIPNAIFAAMRSNG